MLSTDNHPCPNCEISQLKSSDERDSDNNQEVDLINSGLDGNNINNTLPNFSIRDYVFSTRVKDIKNNWPFSHKNLQLCLKYGVKAVLPPFDSSLYPDRNLSSSHGKLSEPSDLTVGQKLTVDNKKFTVRPSKKVETNIQKKCSLIISEATTMSSKVCPVCKTFSSSSNTTLNAHIDQCLSVESTAKWTAVNSKEVTIKHRIKPRKMRSMVDIYETALYSTLEDLNRRNGTNWASNLGFQARDSEACAVETNELHSSSINIQDVNEDSDVYIDSNGTKVRILSKLSDLPSSSNARYDCGPSKFGKREKRNDFFLLSKKKKYIAQKQELLDHRVYSLLPDHCPEPEVNNGQQKKPEAFEDFIQPHIAASDQMKSSELGIIKQWVVSKRSGLKEKINPEHERNLRTKSNASSPGDSFVKKRISASKPQISSDKTPLLLTDHQSHKRKEKFLCSPSTSGKEHNNMDPPDGVENHVSPRNDGISTIPAVKNYTFSSQGNGFSYLGKKIGSNKFSSLQKKLLSVKHTFVPDQKKKMRRKHLDFMKRRLGEIEARMGKVVSSESSIRVLKVQKTREIEENVLKGSETTSLKSDSHGGSGKNIDSFMGACFPIDDTYNNVETRDEFICYPSYKMSDEKSFVSLSDSLDSAFCGPAAPNIECISPHFVGHDSHHDSAEYYVDIDPIPIPGPPGSFLPSPGRMGSEELQGISSLTTCRVQSSEDEREIVDMESLDSPISAISVVSNSFAPAGCESPSVVNWSRVQQTLPETPSPSAPNLVLRLMGKNLMVANKDEINRSPNQTRLLTTNTTTSTQCSTATIDNPGLWRCVDNSLSTSINVHNEPRSFLSSILPGGPSIFDNTQVGMPAHHFDINSSGRYYGRPSDFRPLQFPSTSFGGNFSSSCEYAASGCNLMRNQQLRSYDSPESHEAGLGMKGAHSGGVNPYYSHYYHTRGYNPLNAGSPIFQNSVAQVPFSKGLMNGNLGRWIDCNTQGSSVGRPILPYAGQLRSSMYFSPAQFS